MNSTNPSNAALSDTPKSPLLSLLPDAYLASVLQKCSTKKYFRHQFIVRESERNNNLFIINTGRVRVTLFSMSGKEVSFVDMCAGENFGEISAIDGGPRSASVMALEDTEITVMPGSLLQTMLLDQPQVALQLLKQMASIVRRLCNRIFEYSTLGARNRIHSELLRLARENLDLDGKARIHSPPTHSEIASRVSCHREAVSREMKLLENQGVIEKRTKKLIVPDCKLLETLVLSVGGRID